MGFSPHLEGCRGARLTYGSPSAVGAAVFRELVNALYFLAPATFLLRDPGSGLYGSITSLIFLRRIVIANLTYSASSASSFTD